MSIFDFVKESLATGKDKLDEFNEFSKVIKWLDKAIEDKLELPDFITQEWNNTVVPLINQIEQVKNDIDKEHNNSKEGFVDKSLRLSRMAALKTNQGALVLNLKKAKLDVAKNIFANKDKMSSHEDLISILNLIQHILIRKGDRLRYNQEKIAQEQALIQQRALAINLVYSVKGMQDVLEIFEDKLTITPKGFLGFLNKGLKGTKTIPFASISAIQFKESGILTNGYLQFTIPGGIESTKGINDAEKDENTFMFSGNNEIMREIQEYIESKMQKLRVPQVVSIQQNNSNLSDELQKLSYLKDNGVLSEQEFQAAKKRLIG